MCRTSGKKAKEGERGREPGKHLMQWSRDLPSCLEHRANYGRKDSTEEIGMPLAQQYSANGTLKSVNKTHNQQ